MMIIVYFVPVLTKLFPPVGQIFYLSQPSKIYPRKNSSNKPGKYRGLGKDITVFHFTISPKNDLYNEKLAAIIFVIHPQMSRLMK